MVIEREQINGTTAFTAEQAGSRNRETAAEGGCGAGRGGSVSAARSARDADAASANTAMAPAR